MKKLIKERKKLIIIMVIGIIIAFSFFARNAPKDISTTISGVVAIELDGEAIDMSLVTLSCVDNQGRKYDISKKVNQEAKIEYEVKSEEKTVYNLYFSLPRKVYDKRNIDENIVYEVSIFQLEGEETYCNIDIEINQTEESKFESIFKGDVSSNKEMAQNEQTFTSDLDKKDKLHLRFGP